MPWPSKQHRVSRTGRVETHSFQRRILPALAAGFVACVAAVPRPSDPAQREGFVVTTDGARLAFRVEGDAADTVVVIHGGPGFTSEAVRFNDGFKLFYEEDTNLMSPASVLALRPPPDVVVYE